MEVVLRYLCCYCRSSDINMAELQLVANFCSELELKLKDTEGQLTRSKSEADDAKLRCATSSHAYEVKLGEKDIIIQQLRVSLKKTKIINIENGLTSMSRQITKKQKQEHEYLKNHCKSLETKVQILSQENHRLCDEIVKLKENLNKAKKNNRKKSTNSSRQQETQKISLMTQWQEAVFRCDEDQLRRLMPLVEFKSWQKALFWFVKFDNVDLVTLLLDNETNSHMYIPSILWYAVEKRSEKVCQELVSRKADVNVVDNNGVDLMTFCANSTTNQHCRRRLLSILYNAETNRQDMWVNDEGEEIELRTYCDEGVEDKVKNIILTDGVNQSTDTRFM